MFVRLPGFPTMTELGNQGQKKGHSPYISATAEVIREISVKETSWASPPHSAHASWKREGRAEREQNHMVVVSFQQTELSAVAAATPAPEPNPLHSSQPVHSQGSWKALPAGCFCFLTYAEM